MVCPSSICFVISQEIQDAVSTYIGANLAKILGDAEADPEGLLGLAPSPEKNDFLA